MKLWKIRKTQIHHFLIPMDKLSLIILMPEKEAKNFAMIAFYVY